MVANAGQAARRSLDRDPRRLDRLPDGILAGNDRVAVLVLDRLVEAGLESVNHPFGEDTVSDDGRIAYSEA